MGQKERVDFLLPTLCPDGARRKNFTFLLPTLCPDGTEKGATFLKGQYCALIAQKIKKLYFGTTDLIPNLACLRMSSLTAWITSHAIPAHSKFLSLHLPRHCP